MLNSTTITTIIPKTMQTQEAIPIQFNSFTGVTSVPEAINSPAVLTSPTLGKDTVRDEEGRLLTVLLPKEDVCELVNPDSFGSCTPETAVQVEEVCDVTGT